MTGKLAWLPLLAARLGSALGDAVNLHVESTVDPLKKIVRLETGSGLPPGQKNWNYFQIIAHCYANANDCVVHRARKRTEKVLELEVLTKQRRGRTMTNDPLLDKDKPRRRRR